MIMKYRAPNWENPHRGRTLKVHCLDGLITTEPRDDEAVHAMIFEAGADAMLKALRYMGTRYEESGGIYTHTIPDYAMTGRGMLIWIPDDTEKEEVDGSTD